MRDGRPLKTTVWPPPPWLASHIQVPSRFRSRLTAIMVFTATVFILFNLYYLIHAAPTNDTKSAFRKPTKPLLATLEGYGTFEGTQILKTAKGAVLRSPVDAWLNIDYARQPVGDFRFAPPDWPKKVNSTQNAGKGYGPLCLQDPRTATGGQDQDEACLNFNVYRTPGRSNTDKLPVLVWTHGGSFVMGGSTNLDGAAFVQASSQPLVVVTFQYRLGALHNLPSSLMEEEGLLNLGLRDQKFFLQFVQEYISSFGGDPDRVTLGGQSAGGHSVGLQLFNDYGDNAGKPLFNQTILASGSPTARAFPGVDYALYKQQFAQFMEDVGCRATSPNNRALECLRKVSAAKIQHVQWNLYTKSTYNITWPFQPVSPGPMIEQRGSVSGEDGTFFRVPTLMSSTTDEGKAFVPTTKLKTEAEFLAYVKTFAPSLTEDDMKRIDALYPDPSKNQSSPYRNSPKSMQFNRIAALYSDYAYICPVQETAYRMSAAGVPVYKARFNTPNFASDWAGVPHASDVSYLNGNPTAQFPKVAELYSSYYSSFVVSGDPNKYAIKGAPTWEKYKHLGGKQLVVGSKSGGPSHLEDEEDGIRMKACEFWRDPVRMKRLSK